MSVKYSNKQNILTVGRETTWGTATEPTQFLEVISFSGGLEYDTKESQILTGSRTGNGFFNVGSKGKLSINTELTSSNSGKLFKDILGSEVVSDLGSGEYKHEFQILNSSQIPSSTFRKYEGGYIATDCLGAVCSSLSLKAEPKDIVMLDAEYAYKSEVDKGIAITADNTMDEFSGTGFTNGDKVRVFYKTTGSLPGGMNSNTDYYVINYLTGVFQLSLTPGGSAIAISSNGSNLYAYKQTALTKPTQRSFITSDGTVEFNGAALAEIKNISLTFQNALDSDDVRINSGGNLVGISAGKFTCSGNMSIIFNENSNFISDLIKSNTNFDVTLILDSGITLGTGTYKIIVELPVCSLKNVTREADGDFISMKIDFESIGDSLKVTLHNNKATEY